MATQPEDPWRSYFNEEIIKGAAEALICQYGTIDDGEDESEEPEEGEALDIFGNEPQLVAMIISLREPEKKASNKAHRIPIPHSIYGVEGQEVCLFVKDPEDEIREELIEKNIQGLTEVMGITRLRDDYRTHAQKRELAKQFDLFLTDDRIIPLLHPLLGKAFFLRKKHPIRCKIGKDGLAERIKSLRDSTYLHSGNGPTRLIRVGWTNFESAQLVENIASVLDNFPGSFDDISHISIKTPTSPDFPIYVYYQIEGMEIEGSEEAGATMMDVEAKEASI